jgi:hypothetical protein
MRLAHLGPTILPAVAAFVLAADATSALDKRHEPAAGYSIGTVHSSSTSAWLRNETDAADDSENATETDSQHLDEIASGTPLPGETPLAIALLPVTGMAPSRPASRPLASRAPPVSQAAYGPARV